LAGFAGCSAGRGSYRYFCRNACRSGQLKHFARAASIDRETLADALLHRLGGTQASDDTSNLAAVDGGQALLLWSALSVYWSQLAASLPAVGKAQADNDKRHLCPMFGHAPTGSVVLAGSQTGVHYLHCSLCESR
jgi:FdhE protein